MHKHQALYQISTNSWKYRAVMFSYSAQPFILNERYRTSNPKVSPHPFLILRGLNPHPGVCFRFLFLFYFIVFFWCISNNNNIPRSLLCLMSFPDLRFCLWRGSVSVSPQLWSPDREARRFEISIFVGMLNNQDINAAGYSDNIAVIFWSPMMPLFLSSGVIHDVLFLPIRCLILGGCCFSVCTRAESGYEREAPFGGRQCPVWHIAVSSWSLMPVCVPDVAG